VIGITESAPISGSIRRTRDPLFRSFTQDRVRGMEIPAQQVMHGPPTAPCGALAIPHLEFVRVVYCARCQGSFDEDISYCPQDGGRLTGAPGEGEVIAHRYRIVAPIAVGGMGIVLRAEHVHLRRPFAVKLLSRELLDNAEAVQRFEREAQLVSNLRHPNIVEIVDLGRTDDGQLFLVMELCEGTDLRTLVRAEGPLPLPRTRELARQITRALEHAHARGVVHRDLKSANIVLSRDADGRDLFKVLDFGISKAPETQLQALTLAGSILGTPEYMPPEQATGAPVDGRTDQYSFAIVLYEAITGAVPFQGSLTEVLGAQLRSPPPPLLAKRPDLPLGVEAAVLRALSKDPDQRFPTVGAFWECFDRGFSGDGATLVLGSVMGAMSGQVPGTSPAPPAASRLPLWIGLSTFTGALLLAAAVWRPNGPEGELSQLRTAATSQPRPPLEQRLAQAASLLAANRAAEARALLEREMDARSVCLRALAHASAGDGERAVTDAERCIDLDPGRRNDPSLARAVVRGLDGPARNRAYHLLVEEMAIAARMPLLEAARDPRREIRAGAERAAKTLGHIESFDRVAKLILDLREARTCSARRDLLLRLGKIGDPRALPHVEQALSLPEKETECYGDRVFNAARRLRQTARAFPGR
jgi:serine/threonine-protein kinase